MALDFSREGEVEKTNVRIFSLHCDCDSDSQTISKTIHTHDLQETLEV